MVRDVQNDSKFMWSMDCKDFGSFLKDRYLVSYLMKVFTYLSCYLFTFSNCYKYQSRGGWKWWSYKDGLMVQSVVLGQEEEHGREMFKYRVREIRERGLVYSYFLFFTGRRHQELSLGQSVLLVVRSKFMTSLRSLLQELRSRTDREVSVKWSRRLWQLCLTTRPYKIY